MSRNFFQWQEIFSCDKKSLIWHEIPSCDRNLIWCQEMSSCDRTFLPLTRNFFLWQENSSRNKKFPPGTRNSFFRKEISSCDKKFMPLIRYSFLWQDISSCGNWLLAVPRYFPSCCVWYKEFLQMTGNTERPWSQIRAKAAWTTAKISWEPEDFVGAWLPGSLAPGEYPTLACPPPVSGRKNKTSLGWAVPSSEQLWLLLITKSAA